MTTSTAQGDVTALLGTKLGMTQEEFARTYEISLHSIRDWEQGRSRPDSSAQTLLRLIERRPDLWPLVESL